MASPRYSKLRLLDEIGNCFLMKNEDSVPSKKFTNVVIKSCDGAESICFSEARVDFHTGKSVLLALFWHESICRIMLNKILTYVKSPEDELFELLTSFLEKEDHRKHLQKINNSLAEAEIQSVLAHHLLAPLVPSVKYKIDARHKHLKKCFACREDSCLGDTSFGHKDVWHGYADILIEKSSVKVRVISDGDEEENYEDYSEPAAKVFKGGDGEPHQLGSDDEDSFDESMDFNGSMSVDVRKGNINEALPQAFAQTIVNAFCEVKKNPHLSDYYIPSFLATATTVTVHMYNCKRDRLYSSEDLPIFDKSGQKLNLGTIITVWLSLNFDKLARIVPDDEFVKRNIPKCGFREKSQDLFYLYQNELSKPLKDADRKKPITRKFDLASEFVTVRTDYLNNMADALLNVQTLFEKREIKTGQTSS